MRSVEKYLVRHALLTGEFALSGGERSDEYLDVKRALVHKSGFQLACSVNALIPAGGVDAVAGVELGGALLAQLVSSVRVCHCLVVRKEDGRAHGVLDEFGVVGLGNLDPAAPAKVWLAEDVVTTGAATRRAILRLQKLADRVVVEGVVVVVDRERGGVDALRLEFPGIQFKSLTTLSAVRAARAAVSTPSAVDAILGV